MLEVELIVSQTATEESGSQANAESSERHFVSDEELGQALEDMFEADPSALKLGLPKIREALFERANIRVSEKRLRAFKAQMRQQLPNPQPEIDGHHHHH
jgi:hypothetical protein